MARIVTVAGPARLDLERIDVWTRRTFGTPAALRYSGALTRLFNRIGRSPADHGSRTEPGFGPAVRSMSIRIVFPRGQHRAYYVFDEKRVRIIRILHLASALPYQLP